MATTHLSSYENLKEIFSRLNTKLLNFFAKRSVYGDKKVNMQTLINISSENDYDKNFIYNWYDNLNKTVDPYIFRRSVVLGYDNRSLTEMLGVSFGDNYILGCQNTLNYWCQRTNINGYSNSLTYTFNSNINGQNNNISHYRNEYTGIDISENSYVNICGNENGTSGNIYGSLNTVSMVGSENHMFVSRTSLTEQHQEGGYLANNIPHPVIFGSTLIGHNNNIDLHTDDNNSANRNSFRLSHIYEFGAGNSYSTSNPSIYCGSNEGCSIIAGYQNSMRSLKASSCFGIQNNIGSDVNVYYNVHAFGYMNYCNSGTGIHDIYMYGANTNIYGTNTNNIFCYGNYNSADNAANVTLIGYNNSSAYSSNRTHLFGSSNHVYRISNESNVTSSDNTVIGSYNEVYASKTYLFGSDLRTYHDNQFIIGNYNENNGDNLFEFGDGTYSNRHNILVVTRTGNLVLNDGDIVNENGISLTSVDNDITALDGRTYALENAVEALDNTVDGIEDDITTLQGKVSTLEGKVETLELGLASAQAEILELRSLIISLLDNDATRLDEDGNERVTEDGDNRHTEEVS